MKKGDYVLLKDRFVDNPKRGKLIRELTKIIARKSLRFIETHLDKGCSIP